MVINYCGPDQEFGLIYLVYVFIFDFLKKLNIVEYRMKKGEKCIFDVICCSFIFDLFVLLKGRKCIFDVICCFFFLLI